MPKTVIKLRTYMCPSGHGNTKDGCRFHRSEDNMPPDELCPIHFIKLQQTTDPNDQITVTIMGEDEIDTHEIVDESKPLAAKGASPTRKLHDHEKEEYRQKIRADIIKFKRLEHS